MRMSICLVLTSVAAMLIMIFEAEAADSITTTRFLSANETIVSSGGSFELGFFRPGSSQNLYLGIWYKKITTRTVVWVANREAPLANQSAILKVSSPGILNLYNGTSSSIWSSNTSRHVENPIAQLLDSGNLVVKDANDDNPENFLWQSFDYPTDTLLPGMKLGKNLATGRDWYLSSWKSSDDPGQGLFTYWLDIHGYPQFWGSNGSVFWYRSGPWNGQRFSGDPSLKKNSFYRFNFVVDKREIYYSYDLLNSSVISRFLIRENGLVQRWTWVDGRGWVLYLSGPTDACDYYAVCGAYGRCNPNQSPHCGCLERFVPRFPNEWAMGVASYGCVRRTPLDCASGDGFLEYTGVKLPDTQHSSFNERMNLKECHRVCLRNCSCMAYATLNISGEGSGCLLWFGDLIDIRQFTENGQIIYIRVASSELDGSKSKKGKTIGISLALSIGTLTLILCLIFYIWKRNMKQQRKRNIGNSGVTSDISRRGYTGESEKKDLELPLFALFTVTSATDNFSPSNKLGEGGFGSVYKGILEEGQEIAVKRLSSSSTQGLDEFKNEVICIAKLQHRNLVKLLGCCIQGEEKMLIYEYMPNKSLDSFIFDKSRSATLDWPKRFHIINGIARGLLYLHQDSRLRIIHRDLKASNVLLDSYMSPKISDFGMARSFGGDETEANTKRVVGTYGYMSPEYAIDGFFSVKSDVFSFGVLVLEIVSGKRNRGFLHADHSLNLLGHAWMLYKEGRLLELLDEAVSRDSCHLSEVLRSLHVGLLCVQQHPDDRPTMASVVLMLGSGGPLPDPKQPGFFTARNTAEAADCSSGNHASSSTNDFTITVVQPR